MTGSRGAILLVEDDPGLVRTLVDRLQAEGYSVTVAGDGPTGLALARRGPFDAICLDVMLPGLDGFRVLGRLRSEGVATPVLVLTARDTTEETVTGLKLGADDYLAKPFRMVEVLARIEALIRRSRSAPAAVEELRLKWGECEADLVSGSVSRGGERVPLSNTEWELLAYLIRHRGRVVSRDELLREVWRYAPSAVTRTVDQHVAQLRRKLEPGRERPRHLVTVHQRGYLFRI